MALSIPVVPHQSPVAQLSSGDLAGSEDGWEESQEPFSSQCCSSLSFGRARSSYVEMLSLGPIDTWAGDFFVLGLSCALHLGLLCLDAKSRAPPQIVTTNGCLQTFTKYPLASKATSH